MKRTTLAGLINKNFNSVIENNNLDWDLHCLFYSAQASFGINVIVDQYCRKYDNQPAKKMFRSRLKKKLDALINVCGPIVPPAQVYDDQFYFEYSCLAGQIRGLFKS